VGWTEIRHALAQAVALHALVAVLTLVAAKYVMDLVAAINRWLLVGERAPMRPVLGDRRVALTVNTVLVSIVRYVLYFVLIGWILQQFGIKVGTYLASVSFVAIAVGFGTQGLVQDVVTGFFLMFERQVDVGDMVTVNGQTGVVESFGLRLTEVRVFDGSVVTIPNRSILHVSKFRSGASLAAVDVAVAADLTPALRATVAGALRASGDGIALQFAGIVQGSMSLGPWVELGGGAAYLRARLALWPAQTWVVEGQWVPRLQAALGAAGLQPLQYQIAIHYHSADASGPTRQGRRAWGRRVLHQGQTAAADGVRRLPGDGAAAPTFPGE